MRWGRMKAQLGVHGGGGGVAVRQWLGARVRVYYNIPLFM